MLFGNNPRRGEFESAAMPHLNDLFRTAYRLVGDRSLAEDVVQETYLQAWKSFHRFETGTNCRAWMFKILFHSIHHYRRQWFNVRIIQESAEILEDVVAAPTPIPDALSDEQILGALDRIPADYRAVVLLADVEEFSYKEIAIALDVPIGTVMSRLSRGRKLLRDHLAGVAEQYGVRKMGQGGQGL